MATFISDAPLLHALRKRAKGGSMPKMYSLDCEMVETDLETSSLVGLCLVDEEGKAVYKVWER